MQFKIFEPSDPKAVRYILNPTQNSDERLRIVCCRRRRNGRDVGCTLAQTWCHDKEKKDLRVQDDIMQGDDVPMWNQANMVPLSILTAGHAVPSSLSLPNHRPSMLADDECMHSSTFSIHRLWRC